MSFSPSPPRSESTSEPDPFAPKFDAQPILKYLSLPQDYSPSPEDSPEQFLRAHLNHLPEQLLTPFSLLLSPRERTTLTRIRNRRVAYATGSAQGVKELSWMEARKQDPIAYEDYMIQLVGSTAPPPALSSQNMAAPAGSAGAGSSRGLRRGEEQGLEEQNWTETEFLGGESGGFRGLVGEGKLARLMGRFEEEREAERQRHARQERRMQQEEYEATLEETEDSDEEEDEEEEDDVDDGGDNPTYKETPEQARISFERITREKFIDGLLNWADYDKVDWNDSWDAEDRDDEERWFDEEEES